MGASTQVLPQSDLQGRHILKIFATTGSRSFPFDRLVRALDEADLASALPNGAEVFVQTGSSRYVPKNVEWAAFLSREEFGRRMDAADLVITHGGTGAIIGAVSRGKRVVAVPRLADYGEAVDDHQVELVQQFEQMGIIKACLDLNRLADDVIKALSMDFIPFQSNTQTILDSIDAYIQRDVLAKKMRRRNP